MVNILLKGHSLRHDLFELVRVFYPNRKIVFIEDREDYKDSDILIESSLINNDGNLVSITNFYNDGVLISTSREDVNDIEIFRSPFEKTINVGIKKSLYNGLIALSDNKVPWGILTGIRPVKIVHGLMEKQIDEKVIFNTLINEYKLSKDKAHLIIDIAEKQSKYIYPIRDDRYSLYISIPFCPTRCVYCSFPAYPLGRFDNLIEDYVDKLIYEINCISDIMKDKSINSVYIGGGTPTAISTSQLERIIAAVYKNFGKVHIDEFTVEAGRPDTINKEVLKMFKDYDIKRISINPQTMNDRTLKLIGRRHTSLDIIEAYNLAKDIGIEIINMDLIVGLPGEGVDEIVSTLEKVEKLNPENLTVHTLSVKRGSKFKDDLEAYCLENQQSLENMLDKTREFASQMKLTPYYLYRQKQILGNFENIGYSKEGMECIYNISIMEEKETIIAAGMGSISKIYYPEENRIERVPNYKDLLEYINRIEDLIDKKRKFILN